MKNVRAWIADIVGAVGVVIFAAAVLWEIGKAIEWLASFVIANAPYIGLAIVAMIPIGFLALLLHGYRYEGDC